MPGATSKKKDLYLGKSLTDLNKYSEVKDLGPNVSVVVKSADKLFKEAARHDDLGDEERSYVLFMKYFNVISQAKKKPDYKKQKDYYDSLIGAKNQLHAIQRAETLSKSLNDRYDAIEAEAVAKKLDAIEIQSDVEQVETGSKDKKDEVEKEKGEKENSAADKEVVSNILPISLYNILKDKEIHVMIMDVRTVSDYNQSHIDNTNCINVPVDIIPPGTTCNKIEKDLPSESRSLWLQRGNVDHIILLDWNSTLSIATVGTTLNTLKDALFKFDAKVILKTEPLILEGGYSQWLLYYPMITTNPHIDRPAPTVKDPVGLLDFDYPDFDEDSKENKTDQSALASQTEPSNQSASYKTNGFPQVDRSKKPKPGSSTLSQNLNNFISEQTLSKKRNTTTIQNSITNNTATQNTLYPSVSSISKNTNIKNTNITQSETLNDRYSEPNQLNTVKPSSQTGESSVHTYTVLDSGQTANSSRLEDELQKIENLGKLRKKQEKDVADLMRMKRNLQEDVKRETASQEEAKLKKLEEEKIRALELEKERDVMEKRREIERLRKERKLKEEKEAQRLEQEAQKAADTQRLKLLEEQQKEQELDRIELELQEKLKQENQERLELENQEKLKLEHQEKLEREVQLERIKRKQLEDEEKRKEESMLREKQDRLDRERIAQEKKQAEIQRIAQDKLRIEQERLAQEKVKAEQDKLIQDRLKAEQAKINAEKSKAERAKVEAAENARRLAEEKIKRMNDTPKTYASPGLPVGWEKRLDRNTNRYYYIDHNKGLTHWEPPASTPTKVNSIKTVKLKEEPTTPTSSGLKRSFSSPDIMKLMDEEERTRQPSINRSAKPIVRSEPKTYIKAPVKRRDLNPVYGNVGAALTGLRNLGNTCFMNSTIQCLNHTTPLVTYFLNDMYDQDINRSSFLGMNGEVVDEFAYITKALWSGQYRCITPRDLKNTIGKYNPMFAGYDQQDSQEFLTFLLDGLHEGLNEVKRRPQIPDQNNDNLPDKQAAELAWANHKKVNSSIIISLFQGQLKSTIQCRTCGKQSVTFEAFMYLSLPIPDKSRCSLKDCIEKFLRPEMLTGSSRYKCSVCKVPRDAVKRIELWKLPAILLIGLNRFVSDGMWMQKKTTYVDFAVSELNLNGLIAGPVGKNYNLYAVSNHYGTMEGGHYTAYCCNPAARKWYKFDDHEVYEMSSSDVKSSAGYLLFYTSMNLPVPEYKPQF